MKIVLLVVVLVLEEKAEDDENEDEESFSQVVAPQRGMKNPFQHGILQALEWRNNVLHVSNSWMKRRGFVQFVEPPSKKCGRWMLLSSWRKASCRLRFCLTPRRLERARRTARFISPRFPVNRPAF